MKLYACILAGCVFVLFVENFIAECNVVRIYMRLARVILYEHRGVLSSLIETVAAFVCDLGYGAGVLLLGLFLLLLQRGSGPLVRA